MDGEPVAVIREVEMADLTRWQYANYGPSYWICHCAVCRYTPGNPNRN